MKTMKYLCLAALLIAVACTTACTGDENFADKPVTTADEPGTYTMTVEATKGDASRDQSRACSSYGEVQPALDEVKGGDDATRALSLSADGKTLNATWTAGEEVTVYNETKSALLGGMLVAQGNGASTTLTGTLTGSIDPGDELTLKFLSPDYDGQEGTLEYIAAHCDYAEAPVTVATTDAGIITTTGNATFENRQAIVKFTLLNKEESDWPIHANQLIVSDGTNVYTVTPPSPTSEIYVALPDISSKTISLIASDYNDPYGYQKSGVTFANGQYYEITVKMSMSKKDFHILSTATTANGGDVLYGYLNVKLSIADGATVVLDGVDIDVRSHEWAGLTCLGDATIILKGNNIVRGPDYYPGIFVPEGKTLTILGDGSLTASSKDQAAGIGGGKEINCGNITITGGTVTATGGDYGAGIGSGDHGSCGDITITEGVTSVTATKGDYALNSIGYGGDRGTCGTVTVGAVTGGIPHSPYTYDPTTVPTGTIVEWTGQTLLIKACTKDGGVFYANNENIGGSGINLTWSGGGQLGEGWDLDGLNINTPDPKLTFEYCGDDKKISVIDITADDILYASALSSGWAASETKLLWFGTPSKTVDLYVTEGGKLDVFNISSVKITLVDN